jgi:hypothetical protein
MSKRYDIQSADQLGSLVRGPTKLTMLAQGNGPPTSGIPGYAKGCIYIDRLNGVDYTNIGTTLVSAWGASLGGNVTIAGQLFESATDGITAFAGGGQASATPLTTQLNRLVTVAADGDSVALPQSVPGMAVTVVNTGAKSADVFPVNGGTDAINGQAANVAVRVKAGAVATFYCEVAGKWESQLPHLRFASVGASGSVAAQAETAFGTNHYVIPANNLKIGSKLRVRGGGTITTANGTLQIRVRLGGVGGVLVMDTGNAITPANGDQFHFDLSLSVIDTGATGHVYGVFSWGIGTGNTATLRFNKTASVAVDTTSSQDLVVTQQNGTGNGAITLDYLDVEMP